MAERVERRPPLWLVLAILFAPFVLWAIAEIAVLIWLARTIGWWTLFLLVGTSLLGVVLLLRAGNRSLRRLRHARATGEAPEQAQSGDTSQVVFGSILLIIPGFISDLFGLLFVMPFTRPLLKGAFDRLYRWSKRREAAQHAEESGIIAGEVVEEPDDDTPADQENGPLEIEGTIVADEERRDQ